MARDINQVILIGRLVRDPEIKYTAGGTAVTKFSIANNATYTQNNELKEIVNYFDINVWGKQAENCEKYLRKGSQVAIEGYLRQNKWVDQASGQNRSKIEVTANSVQFLGSRQDGGGGGGQNQNQNYSDNRNSGGGSNSTFIEDPWGGSQGSDNGNYNDPFSGGSDNDDIPF